ncbi:DNA mismatch repair protein [Coprinopsis sp. MPI-PUGE-AT-0042]|nr:DNA mismatch repair protein [Coprinopsis sp. MPI-PUGE-AT-0042]
MASESSTASIKPIDKTSIHRITSGQVVIDLQTAVKELVENSVDAGATNIEVRFKHYGLHSVEIIDNGCGIAEEDFDSVALKHHTSKLEVFEDLSTVQTFGFRGEALSSLCALCEQVQVTTSTEETAPKGTCLDLSFAGEVKTKQVVARKRGTTVLVSKLFSPLPVRRKEFERNVKREFGKALSLLQAYALGPCSVNDGVRLTVTNQPDKGQKSIQLQTQGKPSLKAAVLSLWGPKAADNLVDLDISFKVEAEKSVLKRLKAFNQPTPDSIQIQVKGLTSKFTVGCGRLNADRQFFYLNGRPCNLPKVQKAFNEVYRSFNANQVPFLVADFIIPTESCDVNVSPDKRTVLIHNEDSLITGLREALESHFSPSRSTFDLGNNQPERLTKTSPAQTQPPGSRRDEEELPLELEDEQMGDEDSPPKECGVVQPTRSRTPLHQPTNSDNESMEVDVLGGPPSQSTPPRADERAPTITLDTRKASWGRIISHDMDEAQRNAPGSPEGEDSSRPQKRRRVGSANEPTTPQDLLIADDRRSGPSGAIGDRVDGARKPVMSATSATKSKSAPIWKQLSLFAAPGSQLRAKPSLDVDDEIQADEDEPSGDEDSPSDQEQRSFADVTRTQVDEEIMDDAGKASSTLVDDIGSSPLRKSASKQRPAAAAAAGSPTEVDVPAVADDNEDDEEIETASVLQSVQESLAKPVSVVSHPPTTRPEIVRRPDSTGDVSVKYDIGKTMRILGYLRHETELLKQSEGGEGHQKIPVDASLSNSDDSKATDALARIIDKADFASMDVLGQFNLGFIVVRRRLHRRQAHDGTSHAAAAAPAAANAVTMDDLFIVDQHAADEKYNFETLQQTTKIQAQKLLRPRVLELTAADELLAIENVEVLRKNGFEVEVQGEKEVETDSDDVAPLQGGRLKLTAQPVSKSTVFDMKVYLNYRDRYLD